MGDRHAGIELSRLNSSSSNSTSTLNVETGHRSSSGLSLDTVVIICSVVAGVLLVIAIGCIVRRSVVTRRRRRTAMMSKPVGIELKDMESPTPETKNSFDEWFT